MLLSNLAGPQYCKEHPTVTNLSSAFSFAPVAAASSPIVGLMPMLDGNSWGHCTGMAEIYMNIFSPTAENPLMPAEVQEAYVEEFLDYNGANWEALYNNQIRAPFCLGGSAWFQGGT